MKRLLMDPDPLSMTLETRPETIGVRFMKMFKIF